MKFNKKPKVLCLGQDNTRNHYKLQTGLMSCKLAEEAVVGTTSNITPQCTLMMDKINFVLNTRHVQQIEEVVITLCMVLV